MLKKLAAVGLATSILLAPIAAMAKSPPLAPILVASGGAKPLPPIGSGGGMAAPFDHGEATAEFRNIRVLSCKKPGGPTGSGHALITFSPSGSVSKALIDGSPFAGTSVGGCVAEKFRDAHVPPFAGGSVEIVGSFTIH